MVWKSYKVTIFIYLYLFQELGSYAHKVYTRSVVKEDLELAEMKFAFAVNTYFAFFFKTFHWNPLNGQVTWDGNMNEHYF